MTRTRAENAADAAHDEAEADRLAEYVARARRMYADEECEIDADPGTSEGDDGVWVAAWVFVPHSQEEIEARCFPHEWAHNEELDRIYCQHCGADGDT